MTELAAPYRSVDRRARAIDTLIGAFDDAGAVRHRVAELVALLVDAHASALHRLVELAVDPAPLRHDPELAEVLWVSGPDAVDPERVDRHGNRIDSVRTAIEQSASPELATAAGRLAGEVGELYGEQLGRALEILHSTGQGAALREALRDDLVSSLLVVHDLHPRGFDDRVADCLVELDGALPEHSGAVRLLGTDGERRIRVAVDGGSELQRWRTRLAVERALERAAPDHGGIEVVGADAEPPAAPLTTVIPIESIRRAGSRRQPARWVAVPELLGLGDRAVARVHPDDSDVGLVACNLHGDLYVQVDPFAGVFPADGCRLVDDDPPTVEGPDGARFVFGSPLAVQRTDSTVEVRLP